MVGKPGNLALEPPSSQVADSLAQPLATSPHTCEWWQQVAEGRRPSRAHRWTHRWPSLQRFAKQAYKEAASGGVGSPDKLMTEMWTASNPGTGLAQPAWDTRSPHSAWPPQPPTTPGTEPYGDCSASRLTNTAPACCRSISGVPVPSVLFPQTLPSPFPSSKPACAQGQAWHHLL